MAFRRAVLERIGGFDERLGHGTRFSCEDIDAVASALWAGFSGVYDPRAVVYHHHGRRGESEVRELRRRYDEGRGAYYAKYISAKKSRSEYLKAWIRSAGTECTESLRTCRLPTMERSRREFWSGLRFAFAELRTTRRGKVRLDASAEGG
jgi:GT2 family glycosyltransferase